MDSDADADLVKIYGLTWMKYLGIRTSLVTMHAPWVDSTPRLWAKQRRRNYDVTIARHRTLCSHAWRITGGSRHASTPQYLDKTDSADRRRYSCDVIKTLRATEATCSATSKAIAAAIIRGHTRDGRRAITRYASFIASNKAY